MATPYRGYTDVPGSVSPDVPYRLQLALLEVDADINDTDLRLSEGVSKAQAAAAAATGTATEAVATANRSKVDAEYALTKATNAEADVARLEGTVEALDGESIAEAGALATSAAVRAEAAADAATAPTAEAVRHELTTPGTPADLALKAGYAAFNGAGDVARKDKRTLTPRAGLAPIAAKRAPNPRQIFTPDYFYPIGSAAAPLTPPAGTWVDAVEYLQSWSTDSAQRFDRLGVRVNTPVQTGASLELAIYKDSRARPRDLVWSGTITALNTTGTKNLTLDLQLPAGAYWFGVTPHGDVSGLVLEAIPQGSAFYPVPISARGTTPGPGLASSGFTRAGRTGSAAAVTKGETLTVAAYVPRLTFRALTVAPFGAAALHDSATESAGLSNYQQIVTPEHIYIENDPVLGELRKVMKLTTHPTDTSLTSNPRTQLASYETIPIGTEYWFGFSIMFPEAPAFPETWSNSHWFTIAEIFAPPGETMPFRFTIASGAGGVSLCATRTPAFGAGTSNVWVKPINPIRGKWLDIIGHGMHSPDPTVGFMELVINEGDGLVHQTLDGQTRLYGSTVAAGVNDGGPAASHLKNYRSSLYAGGDVTVYFAAHKVGHSLAEVNPRSYN